MKIAISGKGGVGKTTLSAFLCRWFGDQDHTVLAIDADPATNLGIALAIPGADSLPPITEMKSLIAERTGAQPGSMGGYFKLNPKVDDLPDKIAISDGNVRLMVENGVLGWLAMLWIIAAAVGTLYRAQRRMADPGLQAVQWAIIFGLVGFVVAMQGFDPFNNIAIQLLFWGLIGIGVGTEVRLGGRSSDYRIAFKLGHRD